MQTTIIRFENHGIQLLVDRVEKTAFLMDYEDAEFLGMFDSDDGVLRWGGFVCRSEVPLEIEQTVRSMLLPWEVA
ncbi:hypothetical protein LCGC14_2844080 [marine sediment metagenome]|uniref:Uncharacterized protein n=1 Tax=marine sediment metagenome TaxID=412755 RepID=A0A0F8YAI5_9ZZZZ